MYMYIYVCIDEIKLTSARFDTFKKYFVSYTYYVHFASGLALVSILMLIHWHNEYDKYETKYFLSNRTEVNFVSSVHIHIYIYFVPIIL